MNIIRLGAFELVQRQADDEGLWFHAETAPEEYLQEALRELHEAVESDAAQEETYVEIADEAAAIIEKLHIERDLQFDEASFQAKMKCEQFKLAEAAERRVAELTAKLAEAERNALERAAKEFERMRDRDKALANNGASVAEFAVQASFAAAWNDAAKICRILADSGEDKP